jgi:outer membrane protein assembly factor BamD (BamD/ComL family)
VARRAFLLLAATVLGTAGCAYYNVLYNANQKYEEAQLLKIQAELLDPERTKIGSSEERLYTEAFEKAARVPRFYPDSKWVDDSLLLMGLVSLEKGDYSTAIRKFDEILTLFPKSNLTGKALRRRAAR